ncbi:MAG: hypothetical protein JO276_15470, partial [Sphingomonadaceae bacterium]|nr:hypothetical protein [Sphingomonadaceae bacterium]
MTGTRTSSPSLSAAAPVTVVGADERAAGTSSEPGAARERASRGGRIASRQPLASGQLSAGDHDDLLNPELYADYVGKYLQAQSVEGIPFVDTRQVLTVAVQDQAGRPMPF